VRRLFYLAALAATPINTSVSRPVNDSPKFICTFCPVRTIVHCGLFELFAAVFSLETGSLGVLGFGADRRKFDENLTALFALNDQQFTSPDARTRRS